MFKLPKLKQYWLEIIFLFLVGLVPLLWFKSGYLAAGHDMSYPLAPIDFWLDRLFVWTDRIGSFGSNQTDAIAGVFIHGLQAFFYALTGSLQLAQKFDFIFWFALPGMTMYVLLKSLHPEKENFILRISGSLFYMLNHYLLQAWIIAEMSKFSIVSAIPLVVLAIINVNLKKGSIFKNSLLIGITLFFLNGGAGIPLWGGLFIVALTTTIVTFLISPQPIFNRLRRALAFTFFSLVFILLLNFYWIYPYIASYQYNFTHKIGVAGGSDGAISWSQEISKNASFTNLIKLQGIPDWYDNPNHPYANTLLSNYFFLIIAVVFPAIAFFSLVKKKNERTLNNAYKVVFLGILLISIPFTAGSHPPTGPFYNLALKYIPVFLIFRTPFYKFGMALWFAYAYLVAFGLKQISDLIRQHYKNVPFLILIGFIVLLGIYNFPAFTGEFFNWSDKYSTRIQVPDYVLESKKELDSNKFSTRTLMLPQLHDGNKYIAYDWKYFSLSSIPSILSRRPVLLNDAVLSGNEPGLVNAIYQQLEKSSQSSLLKYTGVDRAIVQDDFTGFDEGPDYSVNSTKDAIYHTSNAFLDKEFGKWKFFNIKDPQTKPLIYIPQSFSYILTETSHLDLISQTQGLPSLADAFIFKHISNGSSLNPVISRESTQNIIIQSQCFNCEEKRQVDIQRSNPPPIYPSNPFYFLIEFIDQQKFKKYKQPTEKIDFILGTLGKEISAMETIIVNPKNGDTVRYILTKWGNNVDSIASYYKKINQQNQREEYSRRIYFYYWNLLQNIQKWRELELMESVKTNLDKFEDILSKRVKELNIIPEISSSSYDVRSKQYGVSLPYEGTYKLAVYNFKAKDKESLSGVVNNTLYNFTKSPFNDRWYFGEPINLKGGEQEIVLPELINSDKSYTGFELNAEAGSSKCKVLDIGEVNSNLNYYLRLEYLTLSERLVKIKLLETSRQFPNGTEKFIDPKRDKSFSDPFFYALDIKYKPSIYAERALIQVCVEGNYDLSTSFELKEVKVTESYPDYLVFAIKENPLITPSNYNLQFVALNQTAYLINVSNVSDKFIIDLNSRFDQQWGLREVDTKLTSRYFKGEQRKYLDGKVIEYERQNKHLLSDFVFKQGIIKSPDIELNAYSNGWLVNSNGKKELAFLIEYQPQKTLYRTSVMSVVSLLGLVLTYLAFYVFKNEK